MKLRTLTLALALVLTLGGTILMADTTTQPAASPLPFEDIFAKSLAAKKGVTVYVGGHTIALVVTAVTPEVVSGRNQQFDEIQVLRREIVAVATN